MKKKFPPMRCCRCSRPLLRAVALQDGQPVQQELAFVDTDTLDLFPPSDQ